MGKIIQNGIEYSGTYSNATSINYDNTNSGLNARTVQEAVDEVNESLTKNVVLFNGEALATDNITLVDSISNYNFFTVYFNTESGDPSNTRSMIIISRYQLVTKGAFMPLWLGNPNGTMTYLRIVDVDDRTIKAQDIGGTAYITTVVGYK